MPSSSSPTKSASPVNNTSIVSPLVGAAKNVMSAVELLYVKSSVKRSKIPFRNTRILATPTAEVLNTVVVPSP